RWRLVPRSLTVARTYDPKSTWNVVQRSQSDERVKELAHESQVARRGGRKYVARSWAAKAKAKAKATAKATTPPGLHATVHQSIKRRRPPACPATARRPAKSSSPVLRRRQVGRCPGRPPSRRSG